MTKAPKASPPQAGGGHGEGLGAVCGARPLAAPTPRRAQDPSSIQQQPLRGLPGAGGEGLCPPQPAPQGNREILDMVGMGGRSRNPGWGWLPWKRGGGRGRGECHREQLTRGMGEAPPHHGGPCSWLPREQVSTPRPPHGGGGPGAGRHGNRGSPPRPRPWVSQSRSL